MNIEVILYWQQIRLLEKSAAFKYARYQIAAILCVEDNVWYFPSFTLNSDFFKESNIAP